MGSSSNPDYPIDINHKTISDRIRQSEAATSDASYNTEINGMINHQLADFNNRDTDGIRRHLVEIVKSLESDIDGSLDIRYGGSVSKNTYLNGLSDVDSLLLVNKSELKNKTPDEVLDYLTKRLTKRFPNTEVRKGILAVTLKYSDKHEIQLLPAIKTSAGYKIPSLINNTNWSNVIKPDRFLLSLKAVNQYNQGKVVPTIKLAKAMIAKLPISRQITGYHVESLAVNIFASYAGNKNIKDMVKHFFSVASQEVLTPTKDRTGQSTHVDDYLKEAKSLQRYMVSDSFSQLHRKMSNADGIKNAKLWNDLIE